MNSNLGLLISPNFSCFNLAHEPKVKVVTLLTFILWDVSKWMCKLEENVKQQHHQSNATKLIKLTS